MIRWRALSERISDERLHLMLRFKNVALPWGSYKFARKAPKLVKRAIRANVSMLAGKEHVDSFTAPYGPWDQRLCVVPDGDLFKARKSQQAHVVTETSERVEEDGIHTASGEFIASDIIVTATGLSVEMLGVASVVVDRLTYRGCIVEGIPNLGICVGYINASWGLRSDLSNRFIARVVAHLRGHGLSAVVPTPAPALERSPLLEMDSGYLQRAAAITPRQSTRAPWTMRQDYVAEEREMKEPPLTFDFEFRAAAESRSGQAEAASTGAEDVPAVAAV